MFFSGCSEGRRVELSCCSVEAAGSCQVDPAESSAFGRTEVEDVDAGPRLPNVLFGFHLYEEVVEGLHQNIYTYIYRRSWECVNQS